MTRLRRRPTWMVAVLVVVATLAGLAGTAGSWALLTDTASADTGTFSATTLARPASATCNAGILGSGSISWTPPSSGPAPQGYLLTYTGPGGGSGTVTLGPTTTSWKPTTGFLDLGTTYSITVQSTYSTSWRSAAAGPVNARLTSVAFVNLFLTCP